MLELVPFDGDRYRGCVEENCRRILSHPLVMNHPGMKERAGCAYFVSGVYADNSIFGWQPIGELTDDNAERYLKFAQEKPTRLARYRGILLSYLCRNEPEKEWGGAVRGDRYYHSISGWPQDLDEVHSLANAVRFGDLTLEQATVRLWLRESISSLTLPSGLIVPVKPNEFASILPDLVG